MNAETPPEPGEEPSPPLPELTEGLLDPATLERLFADLEACAEVLEVLTKLGPQERVTGSVRPSLAEAHDLLRAGGVRGVQIRYRYQGQEWLDTLLVRPAGTLLVRIQPATN